MKVFSFLLVSCLTLLGVVGCSRTPAKTDAQLAAEVHRTISGDAILSSQDISVQSDHGVVTLSGIVANDDERLSAARDASTVDGVKTVVNNLVPQQASTAGVPEREAPPAPPSAAKSAKGPALSLPQAPAAAAPLPMPPATAVHGATPEVPPVPVTAPAPPPPPKKVSIPAGTQITIRLNDGLDTERNQIGDQFHATTTAPIVINDETVIPSGADVVGRVVDLKSAGRFAGNSELELELSSLSVNGLTYNIQTSQWSRQGKGEGKNTAVKAGGGAAIGAIIGGIAGGGKGAAIGSVAGAGAGTGVAATKKGEQIKLAPESTLSFLLINSLTVTQQTANNRNEGRTQMQ
jgi:outer membrane lipoprotein SlyB